MKNPKAFPNNKYIIVSPDGMDRMMWRNVEISISEKDDSMTLLDYFAGQALIGLYNNKRISNALLDKKEYNPETMAQIAYGQAIFMLKEREKRI